MNHDLYNTIKAVPVIAPQVQTNSDTAIVGAIVDHLGFNSATYIVQTGTVSDANVTSTFLLEESDASNMSGATAVPDADLLGTEAGSAIGAASDGVTRKLGYRGRKRYTRLTITPSGNDAGSIPISAMCVLAHGVKNPQTAP